MIITAISNRPISMIQARNRKPTLTSDLMMCRTPTTAQTPSSFFKNFKKDTELRPLKYKKMLNWFIIMLN